eukprot:TRINITY_DN24023_c0_g1_i1.p1 TRINITY_DN24023_c0_g1~~TRINITY_DN24023_c0_g1_i1.p1  ORF type:complete len:240 (-),score=34.80 TRINITY_DN24023_c0_g1_i1:96-815(-)
MTILPSIFSTLHVPQGHVYHTSSMPPRSHSAAPMRHTQPEYMRQIAANDVRTRTTWLKPMAAKNLGEIRNITVLGIISGRLVVAYQGQGGVRVFSHNEHSLELQEEGDGQWQPKYSKYVNNAKCFRYAEFEQPALPIQVLVIGNTEPGDDKLGPTKRPIQEARVLARVAVSGHVTRSQNFAANLGAPLRPAWHHSFTGTSGGGKQGSGVRLSLAPQSNGATAYAAAMLAASQKNFLATQ